MVAQPSSKTTSLIATEAYVLRCNLHGQHKKDRREGIALPEDSVWWLGPTSTSHMSRHKLGIKNMTIQSIALRVCWEWLQRMDPSRPWQGLLMVKDMATRGFSDSLISISVGDGKRALFWRDVWIHGQRPQTSHQT
jgi:hypothetical protein